MSYGANGAPYFVDSQPLTERKLIDLVMKSEKGALVLDVSHFETLVLAAERTNIPTDIRDYILDIKEQQDTINPWFAELQHLITETERKTDIATTNLATLVTQYTSEQLEKLSDKALEAYTNELTATKNIVQEKSEILEVLNAFKAFVDEILSYLRKNSRIT